MIGVFCFDAEHGGGDHGPFDLADAVAAAVDGFLAVLRLDLRLVLGEALGWRLVPGAVTVGGEPGGIVQDIGEVGRRGPQTVCGA